MQKYDEYKELYHDDFGRMWKKRKRVEIRLNQEWLS